MPSLNHFLVLGAIIFSIGIVGVFLNRKNLIVLLMAIELMLLAVNLNFVAFSHFLGDMNGQVFNINADMAACVIAAQMKTTKLVFLSDVPGVLRNPEDPKSLISTIYCDQIPQLAQDGVISGGMLPKLESAAQAIARGVGKVHLIDGRLRHAMLLEIFTDHGIGTQILEKESC